MAIAQILGERTSLPVALLDRSGKIRLFNQAMEKVLGWRRFEVEGRLWWRVCVPSDRVSESRQWLKEALRGALRTYEAAALTSTGARVTLHLEFSLVGGGPEQALLATAKRAVPACELPRDTAAGRDMRYEVEILGAEFGRLQRLCVEGESVPLTEEDRRCHSVLYGRSQPCEDCPLHGQPDAHDGPRRTIRLRQVEVGDRTTTVFEVTTAEMTEENVASLRVRTLTEDSLSAIQEARIESVAIRANLTEREREVLRYLLMGRSIADIATVVGITPRTVKYHQANVLEKVGADSRVDLVRVLL